MNPTIEELKTKWRSARAEVLAKQAAFRAAEAELNAAQHAKWKVEEEMNEAYNDWLES